MQRHRSRMLARLRRGLGQKPRAVKQPPSTPAPAAILRGLGEPSAAPDAGEAELDTLRGELVRELDRLAEGDDGSGSFRRIAS
ncbi:MAG TPA: hypothetical protein VGO83_06545 [Thermoleophilaceae bacterium]|nr:hypothetical protein [Thermoleophilaceae bacterium]